MFMCFLKVLITQRGMHDAKMCSHKIQNNNLVRSQADIVSNLHLGSVQLSGGSGNPRLLTSPPINQLADKWQCIKFWYYSGAKYFKRFLKLVIRNQRTSKDHVVWSHDQVAGAWMYVQLPLNATPGVIQVTV